MISFINTALGATINTNLPGPYSVATGGPVAIVANAYYLALALGGLLAFGSIVYAGIKWTASRGNASQISDAQDQITQAVIGLLILLGTYIILNTINPTLTLLNIPQLTEIKSEVAAPPGGATKLCSNENPTAACPISFDECKQDASGNYGCRLKANLTWVCRKEVLDPDTGAVLGSTVKYCHRPGVSEAGSGKGICNSNCKALVGADCNTNPEQNTGQCPGAAN